MVRSAAAGGAVLDRVRAQLDRWRRTPGRGRYIPEEIWEGAVDLARSRGVYRTSRDLGLNYRNLHRRLAGGGEPSSVKAVRRPVFLDLSPGLLGGGAGCVVELLAPDGARMTVRLSTSVGEGLAALAQALWGRRG